MKINKQSMVYSLVLLSLSSILLQTLGTIYRIIIARLTGAEGMGVYQLIFPFYMVISAASISGLSVAVSRIAAEKHAMHDIGAQRKLVKTSLGIFLISIAIISLCTILFLDQIASDILGDSRTKQAILGILVCLFFTGFENIYKAYFYGIKNVHPPILSDLLEQTVRILAVSALLLILRPKDGGVCAALIVAGMIISEVVSSFCMKTFYEHALPPATGTRRHSGGMAGAILAITFPIAFGGLVNNLIGAANTILIPQRLVVSGLPLKDALESLGILFGMVIPLLMLPGVFVGSLSTIIMPTLSQGLALNNQSSIKRMVAKAYRTTGLITFPCLAVMMAIGSEICYELYGQANTGAYIVPLAIASIFVYFQIISCSILNGLGMQKWATANIVITGIIQLAFTYFLTGDPRFGIQGYIAGYLISDILLMVMHMFFVLRKTKIRIQWASWFIMPALSSAFAGIITRISFVYLSGWGINQPVSLLCALCVSVILYLLLLKAEGVRIRKYVKSMMKQSL